MDFRDVALALAALDGGRSLEELTRLAFEVSGVGGTWRLCFPRPEACVVCCLQVPPDGRRSASQGHTL